METEQEIRLSSLSLGELLKKKAEDGVRVLIMIWGETTSIMGTHDTDTENFFKGTYLCSYNIQSTVPLKSVLLHAL